MIENADLSHSLFTYSKWSDCEFRNCVIEDANLVYSSFLGCSFRRVKFANCWIGNQLGGVTEKNLGVFEDVEFINGWFSSASFLYPRFERCRFKCDIGHVDFRGSQFYDCSFEGKLSEVYFWGRAEPLSGSDYMVGRSMPFNPMMNVDFSKARFKRVGFKGEIDLRNCVFPKSVIFIDDANGIFPEVIRRIEAEWTGAEREKGIEKASRYMINKRDYPLGQVVIVPKIEEQRWGKEFADTFLNIVETVIKEHAAK